MYKLNPKCKPTNINDDCKELCSNKSEIPILKIIQDYYKLDTAN